MRKVSFVRLGVVAALAAVATAGVVAVGCSSDDTNPATGDGGKDSTSDVVVNPADTGATDTGTGGDTGVVPDAGKQIVKLVLVHAAPDLGAFRLCFGTAKSGAAPIVTPLTPLPDAPTAAQTAAKLPPGIYPGTGGPLPNFPIDIPGLDITPFLLFADDAKVSSQTAASATEANCPELIGTDGQGGTGATGLVKGTDYVQLDTVNAGTFALGSTYLLALTGCLPTGSAAPAGDPNGNALKCGADWGATGNLKVGIGELDTTTAPPDGGMNISFAYRASALEGTLGSPSFAANGIIPGTIIVVPPPDAGTPADAGSDATDAGSDATDDGSTDAAPPKPIQVAVPFIAAPIKFSTTKIEPTTPVPAVGLDPDLSPIAVFLPPFGDSGTISAEQFPPGNRVFALPLNVIQYLTSGSAPASLGGAGPSMFAAGENYTFVILGDPTADQLGYPDGGGPNPAYKGKGLHIIAFPNHLAVPSL